MTKRKKWKIRNIKEIKDENEYTTGTEEEEKGF